MQKLLAPFRASQTGRKEEVLIFGRYLVKEFLKVKIFIILFFIFMYCVIDFLEKNTRYFPRYQVEGSVILEYYLTQVPKMYIDLLPFSVLFSTIITLWVFARSGEIAAVRAAGRSVSRVCLPLLGIGAFFSVVSFVVAQFVVPRTMLHLQKIETVKIEKQPLERIFLESNWVKGESAILHFKTLNQVQGSLDESEYFKFEKPSVIQEFVYAKRAVFDALKGVWVLENAIVTSFDADGKKARTQFKPKYPTTVYSQPPRLLREGVTSDQVGYLDLLELIGQSRKAGGAVADREVDLYQKISLPLANFLFILFALPFALRRERQADTYIGIVFCLAVAIVYWVGNILMRNLAQNGVVNPMLAAWTMTVLLAVAGVYLVQKLDRGH